MKGKGWKEHLANGQIDVAGTCWSLLHLRPESHLLAIPGLEAHGLQALTLVVEYSSHCVSFGPKQGMELDFHDIGQDHLLIDHRGIRRAFCPGRHQLSLQLPAIMASLADRQCLFTGHSNWLTLEGNQFGYPDGSRYEVYFNLRRDSARSLKVHVESAYIRDQNHPSSRPTSLKRHEKIKGWLLMLKKLRNEPIRRPARR
ncbi:hypothetical protein [Pseudomonas sp. S37]|uniref:hypothetical protein n=1 Tax=Pseudomonas sp. S37 TaxID=2767449 RepID=UPI00191139D4|nr:hypothetical protein [Pseudomonas sp. S37]